MAGDLSVRAPDGTANALHRTTYSGCGRLATVAAAANSPMKRRKQAWDCVGSSKRNNRLNVSWLGMPCLRRRNYRWRPSLARPNNAISEQSSHHTACWRTQSPGSRSDHDGHYLLDGPVTDRAGPLPSGKRKMLPAASDNRTRTLIRPVRLGRDRGTRSWPNPSSWFVLSPGVPTTIAIPLWRGGRPYVKVY